MPEHRRRWLSVALVLASVAGAGVVTWFVRTPDTQDYLELRLLTRWALTRGSPYTPGAVTEAYEQEYRAVGAPRAGPTAGFIYPPALIPAVAPTAFLPYRVGFLLWWVVLVVCGVGAVCTLSRISLTPWWVPPLAAAVLLLHTATQSALSLGQTALLVAGGVGVGTWAFATGRPILGAALWGLAAVKPQLGVPLLLAAAAQGGWRQLGLVVVGSVAWTAVGAVLTGQPLAALRDYLPHASANLFAIGYNRVTNDQVVGWNRIWFALTGQAIDLSVGGMVLGFAVASTAYWLRAGAGGREHVVSYWLAASAGIALGCGQAKGYDLVLLLLWLPHLVLSWREGRRADVFVFAAFVVVTAIPRSFVVGRVGSGALAPLMESYRGVATALLACYLLVRGPCATRTTPPPTTRDRGIVL